MKRALVAYTTKAGSTTEVAEAVGRALAGGELQVEVRRLEEVRDLTPYSAVVVGAPMILGWHRRAVRFVRRHRAFLATVPLALFFTAMQVTRAPDEGSSHPFPVLIDPRVSRDPARPEGLSFKERRTTAGWYFRPLERLLGSLRPVGAAFLCGKLDYRKLAIPQMLFVMLVIGARPGDFRNWELIDSWARDLRPLLTKGGKGP